MSRRLPLFESLWSAYPHGSADAVKARIGGNVDANWIANTCTVRVSHCFNLAGDPVPGDFSGLETVRGGNGMRYAFRVREFNRFMRSAYGPPSLSHSEPGGVVGAVPASFQGAKGVISFDVADWNDATGHFDLWNGSAPAHAEYFAQARKVMLWQAPDRASLVLSASVGHGGRNKRDDTRAVQLLLKAQGHEVGPVDGLCGARTTEAIRAFQAARGLGVDGRVDVNGATWGALTG